MALTVPTVARATVVVPVTVETLTRRSDDVVVGTVRRASSLWDAGRIVTDYEVDVAAVMKGALAPHGTVVVRLPGGVVGRIGQTVPGVPGMVTGGTYLLFLDVGAAGTRYLTHLTASVVPVTADPTTGLVQGRVPEGMITAPSPAVGTAGTPVALEGLTRAVRAAVQR